jgi:Kef-type K+ transport system membrane component KefB
MIYFSNINFLAVLASGIVSFLIGALWYTLLFGKLINTIDKEEGNKPRQNSPIVFGLSFMCMLVMMFGLAVLAKSLAIVTIASAFSLGLLIALSLISASIAINVLYEFKNYKSFLIDAVFQSVFVIIGTIILTLWR